MAKPKGGLTKWFKEDWRDVKTGKKCGRSGSEKKKRPYPACRPAKVAKRISKKEAASIADESCRKLLANPNIETYKYEIVEE